MRYDSMSKTWLKEAIRAHRTFLAKEKAEIRKVERRLRVMKAALQRKDGVS